MFQKRTLVMDAEMYLLHMFLQRSLRLSRSKNRRLKQQFVNCRLTIGANFCCEDHSWQFSYCLPYPRENLCWLLTAQTGHDARHIPVSSLLSCATPQCFLANSWWTNRASSSLIKLGRIHPNRRRLIRPDWERLSSPIESLVLGFPATELIQSLNEGPGQHGDVPRTRPYVVRAKMPQSGQTQQHVAQKDWHKSLTRACSPSP